jgi:hypothetical protein
LEELMGDASRNVNERREPEAPERLKADLRACFGGPVAVPAEVDRRVLDSARMRLAAVPAARRAMRVRRLAAVAAVAAVVVVALVLGIPGWRGAGTRPAPAEVAAVPYDTDRSGMVDILDAFVVARSVAAASPAKTYDFTGDGVVDGRDVDVVAMAAVKL